MEEKRETFRAQFKSLQEGKASAASPVELLDAAVESLADAEVEIERLRREGKGRGEGGKGRKKKAP